MTMARFLFSCTSSHDVDLRPGSTLRNKASYLLATPVQVNCSRVFSRAADSFFLSSFGLSRARRIGRAYASGLWLATKNPSWMDRASLLFGMSQTTGTVPDDMASRIVV